MKKTIISAFALAIMFASCNDDYLNISPEGKLPVENFWQNADDAVAGTNAMYSNLRAWNVASFGSFIITIASDDAEKGSSPGDASFFSDINNFSFTPSAFIINDFWTGQWNGVNFANQVITNVPNIDMDATLKTRLIAEARFMRAFHYFNLVRTFGGVPVYNGLPADGNYNLARATKEEVYNLIMDDLNFAQQNLPTSYDAANVGRATKGAALSYLAKVYLYQQNWEQAYQLTQQVMGMGYSLLPSFYAEFRIANENSAESIFEAQATYIAGNCDISNSQYSETQGVRGQFGWGFNVPSPDLANFFEPGDLRRDATIIFRGETTPEGDVINASGDNPMYNQKAYVPEALLGNCAKGSEQNIRHMRYSEVLLINAEAANELGNTAQAISSLNIVRNRAGLANTTATDQSSLRQAIYHERRAELAMESDRFWDLVRTGRAAQVLGPLGFTTGKNELFPIPENAITLSNGVLTQNPGY